MAGATAYLADTMLNYIFRGGTMFTKPANVYVSLHAGDPGETGANEVTTVGTGYARVAVAAVDAQWTAPADATGGKRQITNVNPITFASPTGNWGVITHVGYWSAATGGSCFGADALGISRTINAGDVAPSFAATVLSNSIA
jgi:hypothetical protein